MTRDRRLIARSSTAPPSPRSCASTSGAVTCSTKKSSSVSRIGFSDTSVRAGRRSARASEALGRRVERQLERVAALADARDRGARAAPSVGEQRVASTPATTSSQPRRWNASMSVSRPAATSRPFARIATRLQSASASLSTCELKNTVQPRSRSRRISARTSRRPSGSRPDIGSSKMTSSGLVDERLRDADALQHALRELAQLQPPLGADADFVEQRARRARGAPAAR